MRGSYYIAITIFAFSAVLLLLCIGVVLVVVALKRTDGFFRPDHTDYIPTAWLIRKTGGEDGLFIYYLILGIGFIVAAVSIGMQMIKDLL